MRRWSMLHAIAEINLFHLWPRLLATDDDLNAQDFSGRTPTYIAAKYGHTEMLRHLIKAGANVKIAQNSGKGPLLPAVHNKHRDCTKILLSAGASLVSDKRHALCYTVLLGDVDTFDLILSRILDDGINSNSRLWMGIALSHAAKINSKEMVQRLVKEGIDPDGHDEYGVGAIWNACGQGHFSMVQYLVHVGADVNHLDAYQRIALHDASAKGGMKMVNFLLKLGADPRLKEREGRSCLGIGVSAGHLDIVNLLLDHNCDLNSYTAMDTSYDRLCTPLWCAIDQFRPNFTIIKALIAAGAGDLLPENEEDATKHKLRRAMKLQNVLFHDDLDMLDLLLELGIEINPLPTFQKFVPLCYALRFGHVKCAIRLIGSGADPNVVDDRRDMTSLHYAYARGLEEAVERLLKAGANSNARDKWNRLPEQLISPSMKKSLHSAEDNALKPQHDTKNSISYDHELGYHGFDLSNKVDNLTCMSCRMWFDDKFLAHCHTCAKERGWFDVCEDCIVRTGVGCNMDGHIMEIQLVRWPMRTPFQKLSIQELMRTGAQDLRERFEIDGLP